MSTKTFFSFKAFLKECNQKNVTKRVSIYLASSWILLQVLEITWEPLGLPEHSVVFFILILLIGFPLYILTIWKFHLVPLEKQIDGISENGDKKRSPFIKMYFWSFVVISLFSIVAIISVIQTNFGNQIKLPTIIDSDKIAVLKFGNNTGLPEFDVVGKMTADWIVHGITEIQVAQVISPEIVNDYLNLIKKQAKPEDNESILKEYFKPTRIISGNIYLEGNTLILQCTISGENMNETIIAFKNNECDKYKPLDCIEELKQRIIGYLITKDQPNLNLQLTPPKYEAFQSVLNAKANYSDEAMYIDLLNKAITIDSNYFEPKVLRVGYYYSQGKYQKADSLRLAIRPTSFNNTRQRNLLNHYDALIHGKNDKVYATTKKEYNFAPFDIISNSTFMAVALQFVNRPTEIEAIYNEINMESLDLLNCETCAFRVYSKALADVELKKYDDVIRSIKPAIEIIEDNYFKKPLISAYIRSGKTLELDVLMEDLKLSLTLKDWQNLCLYVGKEFLLIDSVKEANNYLDKIINSFSANKTNFTLAKAYYMKRDYVNSKLILENLHKENIENIDFISYLAISNYKLNNIQKAEQLIHSLQDLKSDYQYGSIDYAFAKYYAISLNKTEMYKHLTKSLLDGNLYTTATFQNDIHFKPYFRTKEFQGILQFWH